MNSLFISNFRLFYNSDGPDINFFKAEEFNSIYLQEQHASTVSQEGRFRERSFPNQTRNRIQPSHLLEEMKLILFHFLGETTAAARQDGQS